MGFAAKVLADSIGPAGVRLTTIEVTLPRFVLAELNTHRMLSKSSASSRAIPVKTRIRMVREDPFVPEAFGRNRPGMQASEDLADDEARGARALWMRGIREALDLAERYEALGVHKQLANRMLELYSWHTVIVTATEWSNFFALRCHPDAQPEIRRAAEMMRDAMTASTPERLDPGHWHMPLLPDAVELTSAGYTLDDLPRISIGRCARVSYLTHDGKRDPDADIALADRLASSGHMSPFEHVARPLESIATDHGARLFVGNFRAWVQARKDIENEDDFSKILAVRGAA